MSSPVSMRAQTSHRLKVERGREGRGRDRSYKPASRSRVNQWRRRADSTWSEAAIEGRGCVESPGTSSEVTVRRPHLILPSFEFRREGTNERGLSPMNLLSRVRPIKATPPSPKMAVAAAASFLPSRQSDLFVISGIGAWEEREGGVWSGSNGTREGLQSCSAWLFSASDTPNRLNPATQKSS